MRLFRRGRTILHRAKVYRRRPGSPLEALAMAMFGRRWAWHCTCMGEGHEEFAPDQPVAYADACRHVTRRHVTLIHR